MEGHTAYVKQVCVSGNGLYFASCSNDMSVLVWSLVEKIILFKKVHNTATNSIDLNFDGSLLVAAVTNNILIYSLIKKKE